MSQLFVVPTISSSQARPDGSVFTFTAPEYSDSGPLAGVNFVSMPLGSSGVVLVATAPNAALAAEGDVFAFPVDLNPAMSDADISALSTVLTNTGIPTDFLVSPITYQVAARTIGQVAQVLQQQAGQAQQAQQNPSLGKSARAGAGTSSSQSSADLLSAAAQVSGPLELSIGDGFSL